MYKTEASRDDALRDMLNWLLSMVMQTWIVDAQPEGPDQSEFKFGDYTATYSLQSVDGGGWVGQGKIICPPGWKHEERTYPRGCKVEFRYEEALGVTLGPVTDPATEKLPVG